MKILLTNYLATTSTWLKPSVFTGEANAKPRGRLDEVHPNFRDSARNLLHYLALRRRDLRPLQHRLAVLGLSSLGRAESHVLATVDAVLKVLHRSVGRNWLSPAETGIDFIGGQKLLAVHTDARDASRSLTVVDVTDSGCWADLTQTRTSCLAQFCGTSGRSQMAATTRPPSPTCHRWKVLSPSRTEICLS